MQDAVGLLLVRLLIGWIHVVESFDELFLLYVLKGFVVCKEMSKNQITYSTGESRTTDLLKTFLINSANLCEGQEQDDKCEITKKLPKR